VPSVVRGSLAEGLRTSCYAAGEVTLVEPLTGQQRPVRDVNVLRLRTEQTNFG
jgi:hypothetical protein